MTQTVMVTGVNGDIGREIVKQALNRGKRVFATVRNEAHIASFDAHDRLSFIVMHVDQADSVDAGYGKLDQLLDGAPLNAVIHCAAIESPSTVEFLPLDRLEAILKVNTIGSLAIMQHAFPRLRASRGNLVLASSIWGRSSGPLVCGYSASKWAIESLAIAARRETLGMGFNITLANIGAVKSRMLDAHIHGVCELLSQASAEEQQLYSHAYEAHIDDTAKFEKLASTAEDVAKKMLDIAEKHKPAPRYTIGKDAKVVMLVEKLLPTRWADQVMGIKSTR